MGKINFKDIDLDGLKTTATDALTDVLDGLMNGAAEDIRTFVMEIGNDMTEAAVTGQTDLIDDLTDQLGMVAEKNRVRFVNTTVTAAQKIVKAAFAILLKIVAV